VSALWRHCEDFVNRECLSFGSEGDQGRDQGVSVAWGSLYETFGACPLRPFRCVSHRTRQARDGGRTSRHGLPPPSSASRNGAGGTSGGFVRGSEKGGRVLQGLTAHRAAGPAALYGAGARLRPATMSAARAAATTPPIGTGPMSFRGDTRSFSGGAWCRTSWCPGAGTRAPGGRCRRPGTSASPRTCRRQDRYTNGRSVGNGNTLTESTC
jgi:hypothetical protein